MLILPEEINKLLLEAGNNVTKRGKKYFEQDRVKIKKVEYNSDNSFKITVLVDGTFLYKVVITKENGKINYSCDCPAATTYGGLCKHVIATLFDLYINSENYTTFVNPTTSLSDFIDDKKLYENNNNILTKPIEIKNNIISYYEKLESEKKHKTDLRIVPYIELLGIRAGIFSVSFKVGRKRLYVIKDIYEFGESVVNKYKIRYGKELEIDYSIDEFEASSKPLLDFVCTKTNEYFEQVNLSRDGFYFNKYYKNKISLVYRALDEFFDIVKNRHVEVEGYYNSPSITFIEENPKFNFEVEEKENEVILRLLTKDDYYIYKGQKYNYILYKNRMYRCSEEFSKNILFVLEELQKKRNNEITISLKEATSFCEYVLPKLESNSSVKIDNSFLTKHKAENLLVKLYLDIDEQGKIIADVKFCYPNVEFNPFSKEESGVLNRNIIQEQKAKEILDNNNFKLDKENEKLYIQLEEDIYDFMANGISNVMEKFEVLATERFKSKNIIKQKSVTMGLRIKNDLLEIDLEDLDFDEQELANIIKSYRLKKKFYRLKDGSFVNIDTSGFDTLVNITDAIGISDKDIIKRKMTVPKYRAIYLDEIIKASDDVNAIKDTKFKEVVRNITYAKDLDFKLPKSMENILREYQKVGYNWLMTLDSLGFGGILADDMGLGKTIQVIAILQKAKEQKQGTSIVVCPSSLYINWEKEINRFAPNLKVQVISGSASKRVELIKDIDKYDVVITSYDLLKRDIEEYQDKNFRYIIADEAQYIKNNNTKNAKALKKLKGKTCFALTGTPMENALSELWSIFDFCMPGYLYSYNKFRDNIESKIIKDQDEECMNKLNKLVAPFILRRTKKEVLKELPEKTETRMYNVMGEKQEKIYKAYLAEARKEINNEIDTNGLQNSRMKVLAMITRLRQICCHPSLFLENYDGESSKLEQCIQLVEDACSSNHKILIFSQFTSMFSLLKNELKKKNIKYYELTGKTKADTRVELVDSFNKDNNVKVFLISLKAGGTGLNLIGADVVIHFDPWWNLSVQNQATDRAYRIGQKNNVQVFSLITQNSIEEKVARLQEEKQKLYDNVIKPGETFISKMSKEEVLDLFE